MDKGKSYKQEDRMPDQQNMVVGGDKNVADGRQGNDSGYEATESEVTWYRKGAIRMRSECISCKPDNLGIEQ